MRNNSIYISLDDEARMSAIPFGVPGKVVNSEHPNMPVRVEDDSHQSGGILIYTWWDGSNGPNKNGAFDDWVESPGDLEQFFAEAGWTVRWESA